MWSRPLYCSSKWNSEIDIDGCLFLAHSLLLNHIKTDPNDTRTDGSRLNWHQTIEPKTDLKLKYSWDTPKIILECSSAIWMFKFMNKTMNFFVLC